MKTIKNHLLKGDENILTLCWMALIILTAIGSGMLCLNTSKFISKLRNLNPQYPFPNFSDISLVLIILTVIIPLKIIIESALVHVTEKIMDRKYFTPDQTELRKAIRRKLATNMFKGLYYLFITTFGLIVLRQCDYFPKSMGGKGYMSKIFEAGYPGSFYHEKPQFFDLHYFICLSYSFVDWIWLVFIYDRQSDFFNMLLHHLCTSSLIIFSYVTNYSNVGSIVLFLHNWTDVVVYFNRILLYCRFPALPKKFVPVTLLFAFLYGRIYVFGDVIYTIYYYITWEWEWEWVTFSLWGFLVFLYLMHFNWTYVLLKRMFNIAVYGAYEDSFKFKNKNKTNTERIQVNKKE